MLFVCNGDIAGNYYQRLLVFCKYSKLQMSCNEKLLHDLQRVPAPRSTGEFHFRI